VNKIKDEEVINAPTIDIVLPKFLEFAADSVLVAHNAEFDMGFLDTEKECCWGYIDLPECLCTLTLSRRLFPHEFRHNLGVLSRRLNLAMPDARHRALPDVLLTAEALLKMVQIGKIDSLDQLREQARWKQLVA
jgi:DNA polymerase-3 subunit alpha (Gram-positive type)